MGSKSNDTPLIAIVGQTASGKSALALELAPKFNGEIICADSRTVYRGMDIGTAKPSLADQKLVPHHLLDVADPSERFTVADFQRLAKEAITDIRSRGKIPFLVGGTGLYIDSVVYDFTFSGAPDLAGRERLQQLSVSQLQALLAERNIALPQNAQNPRHLVRALETGGVVNEKRQLSSDTLILGVSIPREELAQRIEQRVDAMIEQGLLDEVQRLAEQYGWDAPALQATSYRAFREYQQGRATLEEAKALFIQNDLHLAKRQRTWFKRNHDIHWISKSDKVVDLITTLLNK